MAKRSLRVRIDVGEDGAGGTGLPMSPVRAGAGAGGNMNALQESRERALAGSAAKKKSGMGGSADVAAGAREITNTLDRALFLHEAGVANYGGSPGKMLGESTQGAQGRQQGGGGAVQR